MVERSIGIGLMGIGTIGGGVARVLTEKSVRLADESGCRLVLKKVLEIDTSKHGSQGIDRGLFTSRFEDLLEDPSIDIIIELIGGEYPAFDFIKKSIASGKCVVTANKEVLAKHGYELLQLARKHGVDLRYEASVGGGIPLIAPFLYDLVANDILAIKGILNGTTNYILTRMAQEGLDFNVALKQAQKLGYAEANPASDVDGIDAAYKLAILATIGFGTEVTFADVFHEGISRLKACDFKYAKEFGYFIKLLAIAKRVDGKIEARVHPVFLPQDTLLAKVDGVFNAINIEGDLVGDLILYGRGAGADPTSSAVVADLVNIAQNLNNGIKHLPKMALSGKYKIKPMMDVETRYYIRLNAADQFGVLAQISKVLGDNLISIASVMQKETDESNRTAEIVIMTHPAKEGALQTALKQMQDLKVVRDVGNYIRIED
jgi:homoserine dehydrogenase